MKIDRRRARVDVVTALVTLLLCSAYSGWVMVTGRDADWGTEQVLETWVWLLGITAVPQLVQAVVGQLVFPRSELPGYLRAVVMVQVWYLALALWMWVEAGPLALLPNYALATYASVVPVALVRLAVAGINARGSRRPRAAALRPAH